MNGKAFLQSIQDVSPLPTVVSVIVVFRGMHTMVSCFGSVFQMALSDITTKCDKVEQVLLTAPLLSDVQLTELISFEKNTKKLETDLLNTATRQLLPLVRALEFVAQILARVQQVELCTAIKDAYYNTISKHHSYLVQTAVSAACWTAPYKDAFFASLSLPEDTDPNRFCQLVSVELMILFERLKEIFVRHQCWELK